MPRTPWGAGEGLPLPCPLLLHVCNAGCWDADINQTRLLPPHRDLTHDGRVGQKAIKFICGSRNLEALMLRKALMMFLPVS